MQFYPTELQLMYKLMDRVPDGISSMLKDLEDHIICAGLDDMKQWAEVITQVNVFNIQRVNKRIFNVVFLNRTLKNTLKDC